MMYGTDNEGDQTPLAGGDRQDLQRRKKRLTMFTMLNAIFFIAVCVFAAFTIWKYTQQLKDNEDADNNNSGGPTFSLSNDLSDKIKGSNIMVHLEALSKAAHEFDPPSRTMKTGYNASVEYVHLRLSNTNDFSVKELPFPVVDFFNTSVPSLGLVVNANKTTQYPLSAFGQAIQSKSGTVKAQVARISLKGSGCPTIPTKGLEGKIAVFTYTYDCAVADQLDALIYATNQAKAKAVILIVDWGRNSDASESEAAWAEHLATGRRSRAMKTNYQKRTSSRVGKDYYGDFFPFPVFVTQSKIADAWSPANKTASTLVMKNDNSKATQWNKNLCADYLGGGNKNKTILVGAHLDGVSAGPGINDNGSGSSVILEIALQMSGMNLKPVNRVRFCWWGSEEDGLWGSRAYVKQLNDTAAAEIALNLNFDMLGSPNYIRGIYNGSSGPDDISAPSTYVTEQFQNFFESNKMAAILTPFDGRSDYGPFIAAGIPSGGLDAGAEVVKTPEQRKMFGGFANTPYDPCYHASCDTLENVSEDALVELGQAAAYMIKVFAMMNPFSLSVNA